MQLSFPFLLVLVLHIDHGIITNHQIVWWDLLDHAYPNYEYA